MALSLLMANRKSIFGSNCVVKLLRTTLSEAMPRISPVSSSLTQGAYEAIRSDLLACRLQPGAQLKIGELCQEKHVSLSAIREALSRLTSEGLVVAEPQRGFRVAPISVEELNDVTTVRIQLEELCLDRAIAVGNVGWEAHLVAAYHASLAPQSANRGTSNA